jgi:deoxyribose-phosphate aldolase
MPVHEYANLIDHTLLKADATAKQIHQLCTDAQTHRFFSVCVNPSRVALAAGLLAASEVSVCTVVGFPLGANTTASKRHETEDALAAGADEIDMVINLGALKDGHWDAVKADMAGIKKIAGDRIVKVILETCLLRDAEIEKSCLMALDAGLDYVKTSTGFSTGGATIAAVALMRKVVGAHMGVKASGGIRSYEDAANMVKAGASRLGTSAGVAIVKGQTAAAQY